MSLRQLRCVSIGKLGIRSTQILQFKWSNLPSAETMSNNILEQDSSSHGSVLRTLASSTSDASGWTCQRRAWGRPGADVIDPEQPFLARADPPAQSAQTPAALRERFPRAGWGRGPACREAERLRGGRSRVRGGTARRPGLAAVSSLATRTRAPAEALGCA